MNNHHIAPGVLCWIAWAPLEYCIGGAERYLNHPCRVLRRAADEELIRKPNYPSWWVQADDGQELAVEQIYLIPLPPDEQETTESTTEEAQA